MDNLIERYYIEHRDELLAFVSSRLGGSPEAEDIVQNVFLRLLTSRRMITEITLPALVYTIARNLVTDYYRRRTSHEEFEHFIEGSSIEDTSTESVISANELTALLESELARIPEKCSVVYRLHIYDGMKVAEISERLGEGYKSVEHRLGTARKAVRQYLQKYA